MQAISLNAHALEVARVSWIHEVLRGFSHLDEIMPYCIWVNYLTAQAGSPYKTEAVTEAKGTDAVIFGSSDQTIVGNAAKLNSAMHEMNMVSDREGF